MNAVLTMQLAIMLPLAASVLIGLSGRYPNLREAVTLITATCLFVLVASLFPGVMAGQHPELILIEPLPGLPIKFLLEPLGMLFALVASFLWIATSIYAIGYMRGHKEENQTRFYVCFAVAISAVMGITLAGNMLTLFIFYEVLTLSTYPLVTHAGTDKAKKAGRTYLGLLLGTSIMFLLFAIVWTWQLTGTLDFTDGGILKGKASPVVLGILLALYVFGVGKAAVMPFHRWLPGAMVAPTPVSALLHAVAVVKAGVFTVLKVVVYIFGIDVVSGLDATQWLLYLIAAGVLISSIIAMSKDNLKARLAYSTVSQLGYITVGALMASSVSVVGSSMHIATHAFGKITLFFCAGAIMVATHKTEISQMRGLGRAMPFTMAAFFIGALSIIGLPPAGGTWSKWFLLTGALQADQMVILVVLMISTLLNIAYLLPLPARAFFSRTDSHSVRIHEAPLSCLIAIGITTLGCLVLFFYPDPLYRLAGLILN